MPSTPEDLFAGHPATLAVWAAVRAEADRLGPYTQRVGRSQVALVRRRGFAWVWRPGQYVRSDVPAVLSLALPHPLEDPRVKEVVHPSPRTWMHHLELRAPAEVDAPVVGWLAEAYAAAR